MINKSRTPMVPSQENGGPSATELLEAITPEQEQKLQAFARQRLRRAANTRWLQRYLAPNSAEDLVQEAKAKVLLGEQFPRAGRRLKPRNRVSVEACLACLRGINTRWLQRYLAPNSAESLVQEAKAKVLLGEQYPRAGRRLKPRNRVSVEACLDADTVP